MWIKFLNLNCGNTDKHADPEYTREHGHIMCDVGAVCFFATEYNNAPGWIVVIRSTHGNDPKLHFLDESHAKACYEEICGRIISGCTYHEIDVLKYEGIL